MWWLVNWPGKSFDSDLRRCIYMYSYIYIYAEREREIVRERERERERKQEGHLIEIIDMARFGGDVNSPGKAFQSRAPETSPTHLLMNLCA